MICGSPVLAWICFASPADKVQRHEHAGIRVAHLLDEFLGVGHGRHEHGHRARLEHAVKSHHHLRHVRQEQNHARAASHAETQQGIGKAVGFMIQAAIRKPRSFKI